MYKFTPNHRFPKTLAAISEREGLSLFAIRPSRCGSNEPPSFLQPERRLLEATIRLMAVLDEAGLFGAVVCASMVAALRPEHRLLEMAIRLVAELDEAGQFRAAAYASMVADAIRNAVQPPLIEDGLINARLDFEIIGF